MASNRMFLRPLGYGEILDEAFQLYKTNIGLMAGICATVYVPLGIIQLIVLMGTAGMRSEAGATAAAGAMGLVALLAIPFSILMTGALTKAVADRYLQRSSSIGEAWQYVLQQAGPYIGTSLLAGALVILGLIFCVIPGIYVAFLVAFITEVMVVEGMYGMAAINRSKDLIGGQIGRVFVFGLILWLVSMVVGWVTAGVTTLLAGPLGATGSQMVNAVLSTGLNLFIVPFPTTAMILLYFDIRVRKEAFDLQLLQQSIGGGPMPPTQPPTGFPPEPPQSPGDGGGYTPPSY